jgi:hypothetical protein
VDEKLNRYSGKEQNRKLEDEKLNKSNLKTQWKASLTD